MNIHPFFKTFLEFALVLLFFVIPSFSAQSQTSPTISYITQTTLYSLGSTLILLLLHKKQNIQAYLHSKITCSLKRTLSALMFFLLLVCTALLFSLFAHVKVILSLSFITYWYHYLLVLLWIFSMALFEEELYRFYLPDVIYQLIPPSNNKNQNNSRLLLSYALPVIFFSFAHIYNGLYAVIYAGISCMYFFLLKKKHNSLIVNTLVHFAYNCFSLYIMQKTI